MVEHIFLHRDAVFAILIGVANEGVGPENIHDNGVIEQVGQLGKRAERLNKRNPESRLDL